MSQALNHTPGMIVRQLLVDLGCGIDPNNTNTPWQISNSKSLNLPDNVITTGDTSGIVNGTDQMTGVDYEWYGVQIKARGIDYTSVARKLMDVANKLATQVLRRTVTIIDDLGTTHYTVYSFQKTGGLMDMGYEQGTKRQWVSMNGLVQLCMNTV